ncbi:Multisubstrate pseudouridine synthase 7 [Linum grandiflorum]
MWQWNPSSAVITVAARCFFSSSAAAPKPYHFFSSLGSSTLIRSLVPLPTSISLMSTIDEADVGILCYISKTPGFRGILKQRYSDFIVNEVDTEGNVVHLTTLNAPSQVVEENETKKCDQVIQESYVSEIQEFRLLTGDSNADLLEGLINQVNSGSEDGISPIVLSADYDKTHRTAVHNFFKEKLKFLVTDTVDGPDASSKCIRVRLNGGHGNDGRGSRKRKDRGGKAFDSRGSNNWPDHLGKFLRFHLYKENKDTQEAIGLIGKMLGVRPRAFGFSGTKDKRSISTQRLTIFKQHASKVAALNDRLIGIKVGDFCHVNEELLLGQLLGNRFTITLRGVVADSEETIKESAESLGRHGFINYFGLQRFGSGSVATHLVGAALLRGEWKSAVNMILDPREGERDAVRKAREYYKETNDVDGTLRQLPRYLTAERAVLQCLKKCPGNHLQALKAIPRTMRMMYVHSYQSYLWNHAASMRFQKYGTQVVLGDLVYPKDDVIEKETVIDTSEIEVETEDVDNCSYLDEASVAELPEKKKLFVKAVTAEDISAGNYAIDDIVLPMPGSRTIFPANDISEVYHDLAKKDAISLTESVHNVKEFSITSMTGSYRQVFQKPRDFEWQLLTYTDCNAPLAETDMDRILKDKAECKSENKVEDGGRRDPNQCGTDTGEQAPCFENGGEAEPVKSEAPHCNPDLLEKQLALKLSFTLPASCYATMAIRELLKTSTSVAFHKTLN